MSLILVGNTCLIFILKRNKVAQRGESERNNTKKAEYFIGFIISMEKRTSDMCHPELENRKAVWQADKTEGTIRLTFDIWNNTADTLPSVWKQRAFRRMEEQSHNAIMLNKWLVSYNIGHGARWFFIASQEKKTFFKSFIIQIVIYCVIISNRKKWPMEKTQEIQL